MAMGPNSNGYFNRMGMAIIPIPLYIPLEAVAAPLDKKYPQPLLPTMPTVATKEGTIFKEKRVDIMQ